MKATILERWEMDLPQPVPGEPWYLDWLLKHPREISRSLSCKWHTLKAVREVISVTSVWEHFAGTGAQALMVQDLFNPSTHTVCDYTPLAALHMTEALPEWVEVRVADAYQTPVSPADLHILDYGDLTASRWVDEKNPRRVLLDSVFSKRPKAVLITDVAGRLLHLHQASYSRVLGAEVGGYKSYLEALSHRMSEAYGYRLLAGFSHRNSSHLAFVEGVGEEPGAIQFVPESPRGLELR